LLPNALLSNVLMLNAPLRNVLMSNKQVEYNARR
jgi:hypothetical protein